MSITSIPPRFFGLQEIGNHNLSILSNLNFTANGRKLARGFVVPKDGTISEIGILHPSRAGTGGVYNVGIMSPDANGRPSTSGCYGGSALQSWNPPSSGWHWVTLDTPAVATAGDMAFWYFVATTVSASNYVSVNNQTVYVSSSPQGANTTWTTTTTFTTPIYGLGIYAIKYNDGDIYGLPYRSVFGSASTIKYFDAYPGTTREEVGAKIIPPYTMRMQGCTLKNAFGYQCGGRIRLYDGSDNVLAEKTFTNNEEVWNVTPSRSIIYLDAPVTLTKDQTYRLVCYADTNATATHVYVNGVMYPSETEKVGLLQDVSPFSATSRSGAGSWTDEPTYVPVVALWIDGIEL